MQYDEFVRLLTENWMWSSLFVLLLLAFIVNELRTGRNAASEVNPAAAVDFINHKEALVLDLRPERSFSEGHIVGSLNIPAALIEKKQGSLQKYLGKPVILIAASGADSKNAKDLLLQKGFQVLDLAGGLQAWKAAGLPLTKG